jgi:hypothetical protein
MMPWTPDAKSAAALELIITRARARAIRVFRDACGQIARDQATRGHPGGYLCLAQARVIVREFGRVTVSDLVDALREVSGGTIPLATLGWVGLTLTGEIEALVKTLGRQMDGVKTTVRITGAIERLQGARSDATCDVERQLGKAALWPATPPRHKRPRRRP